MTPEPERTTEPATDAPRTGSSSDPVPEPVTDASPVFVVGMARSGTTLLRSVLDSHPGLAVAPETHFLNKWLPRFGPQGFERDDVVRAFWAAFADDVLFGQFGYDRERTLAHLLDLDDRSPRSIFVQLLRDYAALAGKPRLGEKTPPHAHKLDQLFEWFPDARVLWMIRDPRAVAASHLVFERRWAEGDVRKHAKRWVALSEKATRWERDDRVRFVRYEDLVRDPDEQVAAISAFCRLPARDELVEREAPPEGSFWDNGSLSPKGPISASNIDAWRDRLSDADRRIVEHVAGDAMRARGYDPDGDGMDAGSWLRLGRYAVRALGGRVRAASD